MNTDPITPDKKKKRKKQMKIFLIALGVFLAVFVASVELTSTSKFCSACHYMKPFFQSWKASSHGQIECKVCHYPPGLRSTLRAKVEGLVMVGRYWTKLYLKSKPWAEIQDESCLQKGCHDRRLLEGQVDFKKVVFDHKVHFIDLKRGKQLRCTSCHSQIVQGEHITVTEGSCFICHFKKSENFPQINDCDHCHKKQQLVSEKTSRFDHTTVFDRRFQCDKCHSQVIIGDGAVPRENCFKCHFEKERLDKYNDTVLIHDNHIAKNNIECTLCHLAIQHKIVKDVETIADCRTCHTGSHQAQKILFTGQGGKGVDHPMPNVMFEKGLSCKGCHMFHEETGGRLVKSETSIAKDKACESCHGAGFARILSNWETSTRKKLQTINSVYQQAAQEVRKGRSDGRTKAEGLLEEAAFNIDVVERGKSVHNMNYSQELLSVSLDKIEEALRLSGSSYKPDRTSFMPQKTENACLSCHSGIEEIKSPVFGLSFPHKSHVIIQNLACTTCHSNVKKHGEFIGTKSTCASCHHKDAKKDCTSCHETQKTFYQGGALADLKIPKDIMAEAETDCAACHLNKQKQVVRPGADSCVECHGEESYRKKFQEWRDSIKALTENLRAALSDARKRALTDEQKSSLTAVESMLTAIEQDGSLGIHNHAFMEDVLTKALNKIKSLGTPSDNE
jgi:nitrate/TMAO reductase-like tetraheme cytochrome c subunit